MVTNLDSVEEMNHLLTIVPLTIAKSASIQNPRYCTAAIAFQRRRLQVIYELACFKALDLLYGNELEYEIEAYRLCDVPLLIADQH